MIRSPHDHECRCYLRAEDYSRMVRLASRQDRSISEFQRHALRRYMDWIEAQPLPGDSSPKTSPFSEDLG